MSQNTGLINGPISANTLMEKLAKASKVMQKVEGGTYTKGNVNSDMLLSSPEELMENHSITQPRTNLNVPQQGNVEKIQNSKLPDAIKQAMIDKPIQQLSQISLNETLDMNFIQGAKRLMEQEGVSPKQKTQPKPQQSITSNMDMGALAILIENTVRKVMDEKLNQILTAQQTSTINENLVLKVGDSIFKGKITGVNKSK